MTAAKTPKLQVRARTLDPSDAIKYACPFCDWKTSVVKDKQKELDKHIKVCKFNPYLKEVELEKLDEEEKKVVEKLAKIQEKKVKTEAEKKEMGTGKQKILLDNGVRKVELFADKAMILPVGLWADGNKLNTGATLNAWTYMEEQGYEIMQIMPLMKGPPIMFFRLVEKKEKEE